MLIAPKAVKPLTFAQLDTIEREEVDWLWYPYIPRGKLTILEGDPGLGKSFITCALAADISTGRAFPGQDTERAPGNVLMLSAEDGLGDTVRPRIETMGGDLKRIFVSDAHFVLDKEGIKSLQATMRDMAATIVILDPLVAYLGGKMDMNKANEARAAMQPLAEAARDTGSAIIVVRHLRKGKAGEGNAKHSGLGSIDFTAAVRSGLAVQESKGGTRFLWQFKNNLAPHGAPIAYSINNGVFHWDGDVVEEEHKKPTISKVSVRDKVTKFFLDVLSDGDKPSTEVLKLAEERGLYQTALHRYKAGVAHAYKTKDIWMWKLSEVVDENSNG